MSDYKQTRHRKFSRIGEVDEFERLYPTLK